MGRISIATAVLTVLVTAMAPVPPTSAVVGVHTSTNLSQGGDESSRAMLASRVAISLTPDGYVSSSGPSISADGTTVAFESNPTNSNQFQDLFVWDQAADTVVNITQNPDGRSFHPSVSADGKTVAFQSDATDLTTDTNNAVADIFLWDQSTGTITNITPNSDGYSSHPSISADGKIVAFESDATNLTTDTNNAVTDIFLWERSTGTISNITADGISGSFQPSISGDGTTVAFESDPTNLTPGKDFRVTALFLWERSSEVATKITPDGIVGSFQSSISADGTTVAYASVARNLNTNTNLDNAVADIFVWDQATDIHTNVTPSGDRGGAKPSISPDGKAVAFQSHTHGLRDIFIWEQGTGAITNITLGNDSSQNPSMSADGTTVAFDSNASNLTENGTNGRRHVFVFGADMTPPAVTHPVPTVFVDTGTPQTVSGTITDGESGADRVELVAVDLGATGDAGIKAWTDENEWGHATAAPVLEAIITGDRWTFEWDPIPGGSGSYVIGLRAYDNAGNKWPTDKAWQAIVIISDTTKPTNTVNAANISGDDITFTGTAADNVKVRKVRMLIRHVNTNEYWNGTAWVSSAASATDPGVLLHTELTNPLSSSTGWSYTLNTTRTGQFQTLHWTQDGAYLYSPTTTPVVTSK